MAYRYFAAGYWVESGAKVFLVHHRKFDKWVPPGGHIEDDETPDQAVVREWKEELNLGIEVLPAYESAFDGDSNATPVPMPFHIDLEREGFEVPHLGYFFYVKTKEGCKEFQVSERELLGTGWFSAEEVQKLRTFDQVRALATYAINHYPRS